MEKNERTVPVQSVLSNPRQTGVKGRPVVGKKPLVIPQVPAQEQKRSQPKEELVDPNLLSDEEVARQLAVVAPTVVSDEDLKLVEVQNKRTNAIKKLLNFSQTMTKEIEIAGSTFLFKVASVPEMVHIGNIANNMPEGERTGFNVRTLNAAGAIVSVDGVSLEEIYEGPLNDLILQRYSILKTWNPVILEMVLDCHSKMMSDIREENTPVFLRPAKTDTKG